MKERKTYGQKHWRGSMYLLKCGTTFSTNPVLKWHIIIHTLDKQYKYPDWEGKPQKKIMQTHLLTHPGETPFKCKQHEARFSHSTDKNYNMKMPCPCHKCELKLLQCKPMP